MMLEYFLALWNILQTFGIFYDHLVHFVLIWYIFPVLESCTYKNLATLWETSSTTYAHWRAQKLDNLDRQTIG
jgi:hypothetical protein